MTRSKVNRRSRSAPPVAAVVQTFGDLADKPAGRYRLADDGSIVIKDSAGTYDLGFNFVKHAGENELKVVASGPPHIVFVYNPACAWCRRRYSGFDASGRNMQNVYAFNAGPHGWHPTANQPQLDMFKRTVGLSIQHYPTVLGVSNKGRLLEYNGEITKKSLQDLMKVLKAT